MGIDEGRAVRLDDRDGGGTGLTRDGYDTHAPPCDAADLQAAQACCVAAQACAAC